MPIKDYDKPAEQELIKACHAGSPLQIKTERPTKGTAENTIRAEFAESVGENSVHGSDAPETAAEEIAYFFSGLELVG